MSEKTIETIKIALRSTLELDSRVNAFAASTPLFGGIPELDSLSVVYLIANLETRFEIEFDDDEITASAFETIGSLAELIEKKLPSGA